MKSNLTPDQQRLAGQLRLYEKYKAPVLGEQAYHDSEWVEKVGESKEAQK